MKIISGFCLFIICTVVRAQEPLVIKNGEKFNVGRIETFLQDLHKQNDYVITFRVNYRDLDKVSDYFVLTRKEKNLKAYNYSAKSDSLVALVISAKALDLVWETFLQNELFSLQNEKDIANFCPGKYQIYNSYSYEFVLISHDVIKNLSYYNPEHYDSVCYGVPERRKIINSVAVITHVLNL